MRAARRAATAHRLDPARRDAEHADLRLRRGVRGARRRARSASFAAAGGAGRARRGDSRRRRGGETGQAVTRERSRRSGTRLTGSDYNSCCNARQLRIGRQMTSRPPAAPSPRGRRLQPDARRAHILEAARHLLASAPTRASAPPTSPRRPASPARSCTTTSAAIARGVHRRGRPGRRVAGRRASAPAPRPRSRSASPATSPPASTWWPRTARPGSRSPATARRARRSPHPRAGRRGRRAQHRPHAGRQHRRDPRHAVGRFALRCFNAFTAEATRAWLRGGHPRGDRGAAHHRVPRAPPRDDPGARGLTLSISPLPVRRQVDGEHRTGR